MRCDDIFKFADKVKSKYGDEFIVVGDYVNSKTPIEIKHRECNTIYTVIPNKFIQKKKLCPKCKTSSKKYSKEYIEDLIYKLDPKYRLLSDYNGMKKRITLHHVDCNNSFEVIAESFIRDNRRCPYCTGNYKKKDTEFLRKEIRIKLGKEYSLISEYNGVHNKVKIKHEKCNHEFFIYPTKQYISEGKNICPLCNGYNKNIDKESLEKELKYYSLDKEYILLNDEYIDTHTPLKFKHSKCGKEVYISRTNLLSGKQCKYCSMNGISKAEKEISDYIKSMGVEVKENYRINNFELDIYVPKMNIAFEYNGLYWHSDLYKENNYHINKTNKCKELGIRLIHIFEDEWINKQTIVKRKIKYILNKNDNTTRIYARKCFIKEIKSDIKNEFLNRYHIQGKDSASIKLGLFYKKNNKNVLISVMTFCKPRISLGQKNSKYDYELSRFASCTNYIVVGAFGKLFNYFKENYVWNKLITYADKRYSEGNVYLKNGWTHTHDSKPSYSYIDKRDKLNRQNRFKYRKSVLKEKFPNIYSDDKSEKTIMAEAGFTRIWDCGNMVFEYNK